VCACERAHRAPTALTDHGRVLGVVCVCVCVGGGGRCKLVTAMWRRRQAALAAGMRSFFHIQTHKHALTDACAAL
jgi:hypothetical protein